jgi:tetratricopeptide (TPR) repeat protein
MVSLGNILHRTRHHKDAVVVLEAALEISPDLNVIHFTLGNIYAHIGEYNKAEKCFEHTAKLKPFFEAARVRLHAVRCQRELEQTLDNQQNLLERALHELESYKDEFEVICLCLSLCYLFVCLPFWLSVYCASNLRNSLGIQCST